jgi:hypothetical protein
VKTIHNPIFYFHGGFYEDIDGLYDALKMREIILRRRGPDDPGLWNSRIPRIGHDHGN